MLPHHLTSFEIRIYHQNEPELIMFIQEIIYLKQRMGHI